MPSIETIISFLVARKFGLSAILIPTLATFDKADNGENSKKVTQIEAYKLKLKNLQSNALLSLYNSELEKQENERFYNQLNANADFIHWSKAARWTIDEAVALSFGKEPELVTWNKIEKLKNETAFAKTFAKRRDLAIRAVSVKKLNDPVMPVVFISWAKELHIELPNELLVELEKAGNIAIDWRKEWLKLKANYDAMQKKAPENTQQTENLLQAVACMAMDGYGDKPNDSKRTAPTEISNALKNNGKAIDRKTIKSWIDKGISLLPRKPL